MSRASHHGKLSASSFVEPLVEAAGGQLWSARSEGDLERLFTSALDEMRGRYVDVKELPNGSFLLDFNFSYNPACACSDHYNCPIPLKGNTLTVAIRAGEMDSHYR